MHARMSLVVFSFGALYIPTAQAETTICTTISSLPMTISAPGAYCLRSNPAPLTALSGSAISINADDVVLDLNGFKIENTAPANQMAGVSAVDRKGLIIRNGVIRGFYRGVYISDTGASLGHLIDAIRADANRHAGIWVEGEASLVRRSQVTGTGGTTAVPNTDTYGIRVAGSGVRVLDNDVSETLGVGTGVGKALFLEAAHGAVVDLNRAGNTTLATGYAGITVMSGDDLVVSANYLTTLEFGVIFVGGSGKYRDNLTAGVITPYTGGTDAGNNQ